MNIGTGTFLLRGVGGLEDEDGLGGQEDARRVEELGKLSVDYCMGQRPRFVRRAYRMCRKKIQRMGKNAGPDGCSELWRHPSAVVKAAKGLNRRSIFQLGL